MHYGRERLAALDKENAAKRDFIECPQCKKRSYSQGDIDHKFCLDCGWHIDIHREMNFVKFLEENLYTDIKKIDDSFVGILRFMYTCGVCFGLDKDGYKGRFCFDTYQNAELFLKDWDGKSSPIVGEDGCTAIKR